MNAQRTALCLLIGVFVLAYALGQRGAWGDASAGAPQSAAEHSTDSASGPATESASESASAAEAQAAAALRSRFDADIAPLLETYCINCHGEDVSKGKVTLHQLSGATDDADSIAMYKRVLEQLEIGAMPPKDRKQPDAQQREAAVAWIKDQLTAAGNGFELQARLLLPEYGNRVSHELLFSGQIQDAPYTPARLWRMSPHVFRGKRYQLSTPGGLEAEPVAYASKSSGIRDYASQELMDESGFVALQMAFDDIITTQLHERESFKAITESPDPPSSQTIQRVIREEFLRATGRAIKEDELTRYTDFMTANISQAGNESGLKISLMAIYLSTQAVYRFELGRGEPDEHGRRMLSPQEVALALAYALTDAPPADNAILSEALANHRLSTREDIEKVVRRMIAAGSPPIRKDFPAAPFPRMVQEGDHGYAYYPRVVRFFEEFFQYPKSAGVFKDSPGEGVGGRALVGWPQGHIAAIVNEDRHVFEELLTSPRFNNNKDQLLELLEIRYRKKLAAAPESEHEAIHQWYQGMLKASSKLKNETFRAGILTDPSWLITFSTNNENDPVHRGIWVRERLLAGSVPDLPLDVDARVPEDHDKTLRERYEVTQAPACWRCHKAMNPLGMPFESFDDRGWVREARYFDKTNNVYLPEPSIDDAKLQKLRQKNEIILIPVDATGEISGTGEPGIDGPVTDARDMVHRLARSTRVRQSIIRHAFRYWMGRNEMLSDSKTLIAADQAYVNSGGKFSEVLIALLTSDSFLYRK